MANCIIYCDGSGKNARTSWAILALKDNTIHESYGSYSFPLTDPTRHQFEDFAFLKACLYARDNGIPPESTTIYTDNEVFGSIGSVWNPENYHPVKPGLKGRLRGILVKMGLQKEDLDTLVPYFLNARISYLRSHRGFVYQERVDYIAKIVAQDEVPAEYDDWLMQGVSYWRNNNEVYRYPFAFVPMAEGSHLPSFPDHPIQLDGNHISWPDSIQSLPIQEFIALAGLRLHMQQTQEGWRAELQESVLNERGGFPISARGYGSNEEQALIALG